MPTSPRIRYKGRGRTGGEIGEAPPVADAARRFRGSAPIGGRDSGRESVGTTVGKRTPPLRKRNKRCDGRATARVAPTESFPIGFRKVYPTPFLHISCSLCVDSLWINFPSPFLPLSCGNPSFSPVDKKSRWFAALWGFSTKVFSTTIITKKYLVYVLWAENMPGNFGIRKESVPC